MNFNPTITEYIGKAPEEKAVIMEEIRQLIHDIVDEVTEEIKWGFPVFSKKKNFAYLSFSKKHITLGFYDGGKLKDPENLLEGAGNTLKHIKIRTIQDARKPDLKQWLQQASSGL
jgi:hypothetical protein